MRIKVSSRLFCILLFLASLSMMNGDTTNNMILSNMKQIKCIFSDLDGTLCHFERDTIKHGVKTTENKEMCTAIVRNKDGQTRACRLLPASTMGNGTVSERTIELVGKLRAHGVKFVIISGARTTTIQERLPFLPLVDAVACETGSKIFYPPDSTTEPVKASSWMMDEEWSKRFEKVTGPLNTDTPAVSRQGTLWDLFREMKALRLDPDARGYYGCFRVKCRSPESLEILSGIISDSHKLDSMGIAHAMNLGMYDFFPKSAGKGSTVRYLQQKWGLREEECVALFDDDNDLPMAALCGAGFLPGITSASVQARVEEERNWRIAESAGTGVFATEEILEQILQQVERLREEEKAKETLTSA